MTDVQMTAEAAATVNNRFDDLAAELGNAAADLATVVSDIEAGAGEFVGSISHGSSVFAISWREAFKVCGTDAAIIAGNTNQLSVDLAHLDRDASTTISL